MSFNPGEEIRVRDVFGLFRMKGWVKRYVYGKGYEVTVEYIGTRYLQEHEMRRPRRAPESCPRCGGRRPWVWRNVMGRWICESCHYSIFDDFPD